MIKKIFSLLIIILFLSSLSIAESFSPNTNGLLLDYEKAIDINTTYLNNISSQELNLCIQNKDQAVKDKCVKKFNRVNGQLIKMTIEILNVKSVEKNNE